MAPPFISFVIPTLNAERLLPGCLQSIRLQDYNPEGYEILVADGGSTDRTRAIAEQYGCSLVEATGLLAEASKNKCFDVARGEYMVMLDADNAISSPDWLRRAMKALEKYPDALGFESYYLKAPHDNHLNRFLTGCLLVCDPFASAMATPPTLQSRDIAGVELWELPSNGGYPTGANGFIFKKTLLRQLGDTPYHEAAFFPALVHQGMRQLVRIRGLGVYHYYINGWRDYIRKRRRTVILYKMRQQELTETWDRHMGWKRKLTFIWTLSLIGPLLQSLLMAIWKHDWEWLLFAPAATVSAFANAAGLWEYSRASSHSNRHASAMKLSK